MNSWKSAIFLGILILSALFFPPLVTFLFPKSDIPAIITLLIILFVPLLYLLYRKPEMRKEALDLIKSIGVLLGFIIRLVLVGLVIFALIEILGGMSIVKVLLLGILIALYFIYRKLEEISKSQN